MKPNLILLPQLLPVIQCHTENFGSVMIKELLKSINIWRRYGQSLTARFCGLRCIGIRTKQHQRNSI